MSRGHIIFIDNLDSFTYNLVDELAQLGFGLDVYRNNVSLEFIAADNQLTLGNNYPNPFQVKTIIPLTIPSRMNAKIVISNILGMDVKTILDEQLEAGYYEIPVSLDGLASGTYFYRLITDQSTKTRNMMLIN